MVTTYIKQLYQVRNEDIKDYNSNVLISKVEIRQLYNLKLQSIFCQIHYYDFYHT